MSEEPRMLQAADVYNATHDLRLYEWVTRLESQNQALQEGLDHEHANRMTLLANHTALQEENEWLKGLDEHTEWERAELWREKANNLDRITRALQERIQDLTHDDLWGAKYAALQEALERAWKHEDEFHAYCSAFSPALERAALSPTQETDPE